MADFESFCGKNKAANGVNTGFCLGLKIPRRKACRFESGPGHHDFKGLAAMQIVARLYSFRIPFRINSAITNPPTQKNPPTPRGMEGI